MTDAIAAFRTWIPGSPLVFKRGVILLVMLGALLAHLETFAQSAEMDAVNSISDAAAAGNAEAMFALATVYEVGKHAPRDLSRAVQLLEQAAEQDFGPALTQLGLMNQAGRGMPRDERRAHQLFRRAVAAGDTEGEFRLAMSLLYGIGTKKDKFSARHHLAGAAHKGHQEAQLALGEMIYQAIGGERNDFAARRWLRAAAAGPDAEVSREAAALAERLERRILYHGMKPETVAAIAAVAFGIIAIAASSGDEVEAFKEKPDHAFNPWNYDAFGTTKRRQTCQFVSNRTGMAITSGPGAFFYGHGNQLVCR